MTTVEESKRIKRFESAYNRIDKGLTELIHDDGHRRRTFAARVRVAANKHRRLSRFQDFLLEIGELRNAMVHNRTGDELFLAVPSERTVSELERIENRITAPGRVIPTFSRPVTTLRPDQSLYDAWQLVSGQGFSRYPVYRDDTFIGLLTSNGFTRWCAAQLTDGLLNIDTHEVRIAEVLAADHHRDQVQFVSRNALIDDAEILFTHRKPLEAVIITEHGKKDQRPLGMITASDLAALDS